MAGVKEFKKVGGLDEGASKLQDRLDEFFKQFVGNPLLDGVLVQAQIGTTPTRIEHKLRRAPLGYIVVHRDANATIWTASNDLSSAFLTLQASLPVTVNLWVF